MLTRLPCLTLSPSLAGLPSSMTSPASMRSSRLRRDPIPAAASTFCKRADSACGAVCPGSRPCCRRRVFFLCPRVGMPVLRAVFLLPVFAAGCRECFFFTDVLVVRFLLCFLLRGLFIGNVLVAGQVSIRVLQFKFRLEIVHVLDFSERRQLIKRLEIEIVQEFFGGDKQFGAAGDVAVTNSANSFEFLLRS